MSLDVKLFENLDNGNGNHIVSKLIETVERIEGKDVAECLAELVNPQQVEIKAEQLVAEIGSGIKLADDVKRCGRDQQDHCPPPDQWQKPEQQGPGKEQHCRVQTTHCRNNPL